MATTHLFAVGRITGGSVDILLAPARQQPVCGDSHGCRCYAYSHGYDDAKAGYLPEPLHHVSALCCVERYLAGHRDGLAVEMAQKSPLTKHAHIEYLCSLTQDEEPAPASVDGELQRLIDEAADTEDYEWDIDDRAIWRRGGW